MRAGHDVGDDLGFRRVRHRRLEHADDRRRARRRGGRSCRSRTDRCSAPWSRSDRSAPPRPRRSGRRRVASSSRPSTGRRPITSKYVPPTTPARTTRGSPRPTIVKPMVEKSPNALSVLTRAAGPASPARRTRRSRRRCRRALPDVDQPVFVAIDERPQQHAADQLKIAALAPMPSASVRTTVMARPLTRASDRTANLKSVMRLIRGTSRFCHAQIDTCNHREDRYLTPLLTRV